MLALRDQENLVHGHQTAAAAKPLNQGARALAPKTPANKSSKTTLRKAPNDENAAFGQTKGPAKLQLKGQAGGDTVKTQNLGDRSAFITPVGPRTRAPLGAKTTNAKAKLLQTPGLGLGKDTGRIGQKNGSVKRAKDVGPQTEGSKLEVLADTEDLDSRDIEYAPPKVDNMPDIPDDIPPIDVSMFKGVDFLSDAIRCATERVGHDGLTWFERQEKEREAYDDRERKRCDAKGDYDFELRMAICMHDPECEEGHCAEALKTRKRAEAQYKSTLAAIQAEAPEEATELRKDVFLPPSTLKPSPPVKPKASSTLASRVKPTAASSAKAQLQQNLSIRPKKAQAPTTSSYMRHQAATAASRSTIGYAKGREMSDARKKLAQKAGLPNVAAKGTSRKPTIAPRSTLRPGVQHEASASRAEKREDTPVSFEDDPCLYDMASADYEFVLQE